MLLTRLLKPLLSVARMPSSDEEEEELLPLPPPPMPLLVWAAGAASWGRYCDWEDWMGR